MAGLWRSLITPTRRISEGCCGTLARSASEGVRRCALWTVVGFMSAIALATAAFAQVTSEVEQIAPADGQPAERPAPIEGARYNEPPLPPYDYWQPTWMPCQSLRTNRSLVLGHLYWGAEILGWATKGVHAPALVTTSPPGTAQTDAGVIGAPGTTILFGDETINKRMRPGGRLTIGWWFDPNQYRGIEFQYMELDSPHRFQASSSGGSPILARPIVDANTGDNSSVITSYPGVQNGSITVDNDLQLTSTGILFRDLFWASQIARVDYLVGYRHAHLFDRVRTFENLTSLDASSGFPDGTAITRGDQFRTVNQFDGADFGFKGWWSPSGTLALTSLTKVAIGATNNDVIVNGYTTTGSGRTATTTQGGVLALPSNIHSRAIQDFGYIYEVGGGLEWRPYCYWKFTLGYTFFYWNQVARAASQIDTRIDQGQLAQNNSPTNCGCPAFHLRTTSFWAQGLNAGFNYQF